MKLDGRIFGGPGAECRVPQQSQRSCRAGFCGVKRKKYPGMFVFCKFVFQMCIVFCLRKWYSQDTQKKENDTDSFGENVIPPVRLRRIGTTASQIDGQYE